LSTTEGAGDLYKCTGSSPLTCAKSTGADIPEGYLFNNDPISQATLPFIKCMSTTSGGTTTKSCTSMKVEKAECGTGTGKAGIGELIKVTSEESPNTTTKYRLCLDSTISVELDSTLTDTDNYIISIGGSGNVFGSASDSYIFVINDKEGVHLPTTSSKYIII